MDALAIDMIAKWLAVGAVKDTPQITIIFSLGSILETRMGDSNDSVHCHTMNHEQRGYQYTSDFRNWYR
jgi:hypothetical protein